MSVEFDRNLLLAIFLRGLPSTYKIIITNIRHTAGVTIEEAVRALIVEERALKEDSSAPDSVLTVVRDCKHCGKRHNSKDCWFKFPEKRLLCNKCGGRNHWEDKCNRKPYAAYNVTLEEESYVL